MKRRRDGDAGHCRQECPGADLTYVGGNERGRRYPSLLVMARRARWVLRLPNW